MVRGSRYLGRRRSSLRELRAVYTHLKKHSTSLFEHWDQTSTHFHVGFRLLKNTSVREMKEWAFRGTRKEEPNGDSLTDLPFTPACYTSLPKSSVIMEA